MLDEWQDKGLLGCFSLTEKLAGVRPRLCLPPRESTCTEGSFEGRVLSVEGKGYRENRGTSLIRTPPAQRCLTRVDCHTILNLTCWCCGHNPQALVAQREARWGTFPTALSLRWTVRLFPISAVKYRERWSRKEPGLTRLVSPKRLRQS